MRVAFLLLIGGCTGGDGIDSATCTTDEQIVNWQNFGAGFFAGYCRTCHSEGSADRLGAPVGIDFDTEGQVRALRDAVRRTTLEEGTMPVGGGVQASELSELEIFLECGI